MPAARHPEPVRNPRFDVSANNRIIQNDPAAVLRHSDLRKEEGQRGRPSFALAKDVPNADLAIGLQLERDACLTLGAPRADHYGDVASAERIEFCGQARA